MAIIINATTNDAIRSNDHVFVMYSSTLDAHQKNFANKVKPTAISNKIMMVNTIWSSRFSMTTPFRYKKCANTGRYSDTIVTEYR